LSKPTPKQTDFKGTTQPKLYILKREANRKLDLLQRYIGIALLASAAFGIYLLATDKSLWLLAVSHAYGLAAICFVDVIFGLTNLSHLTRKLFPLSYGWAFLTILLQLGDIATAPQYKMTVQYFAGYLFGLWAYDAILATQVVVIFIGFYARSFEKILVRKKQLTYFDMGLNKGRRDFLQIIGAIGGLIALAAVLGASYAINNTGTGGSTGTTQTSTLPNGAIANKNSIQVGVPVYFDYPSAGYPNMLLMKADGSLIALSMLCTHVCCQCQYDSASTDILCPCHGSVFDQGGNVVRGPAAVNLPMIELSVDSNGNVFPVKVVGSSPCVS
jgi:arsenite oxidase small subunit